MGHNGSKQFVTVGGVRTELKCRDHVETQTPIIDVGHSTLHYGKDPRFPQRDEPSYFFLPHPDRLHALADDDISTFCVTPKKGVQTDRIYYVKKRNSAPITKPQRPTELPVLLSPPPGLGRRQSVRIQEVLEASKNKTIAKEQHAVDEDAMSEPEELDTMAATSVGFDLNRKNSASSSMGFTNCVFDKCVVCGRHPVDGREAPCGHVACCKCWLSYLQEQPDHQCPDCEATVYPEDLKKIDLCSICYRKVLDPWRSPCKHLACKKCWTSYLEENAECPDCSAPVDRKLLVSCITGDLKRSRSQDVVQSMSGWLVQSSSVGSRNGSLAHPTSLAHALLVPPTHDEMDESSFVSSMRSHSALSLQPEMNTSTIL